MSPWPPEGEPEGKGTKPVTLPRPGHADLAGVQKHGLADVRDALERASARHTAVHVAAGAVAKALLREIGIEVAGEALPEAGADPAAVDAARAGPGHARRPRRGAGARRPAGARQLRAQGGPARRTARGGGHGDPGREGRRDRRRLRARRAARLGGARRDRHRQAAHVESRGRHRGRRLERRGDRRPGRDEAAADAHEAARAPSTSRRASRRTRSSSGATSRRSRRSPSSPRRRSRGSSPARRARSSAATRSATSSAPGARTWSGSEAERRDRRLHGRGQVHRGPRARRYRRRRPRRVRAGKPIAEIFREEGEAAFRALEEQTIVLALGGGAVTLSRRCETRSATRSTIWLDVDVDTCWERVRGSDRPLAQDEAAFRRLYEERRALYADVADVVARDAHDVVLAAAGVHVERGALQRLGELVPGDGPVALVSDPHVAGIHGMDAQLALGSRLAETHELPPGEEAKTLTALDRLWQDLRLDRSGTVVALGGGCTTDAAGLRGGGVPPRHRVDAGPDEPRRPGRRGDRRQDGDRPAAGQEPRRRLPLAGAHGRRSGAARDPARAAAPRRDGRGREDGAARGRAVLGASRRRARPPLRSRSRPRSACAIRTSAASARAQPRPHVRARARGRGRLRGSHARARRRARPARGAAPLRPRHERRGGGAAAAAGAGRPRARLAGDAARQEGARRRDPRSSCSATTGRAADVAVPEADVRRELDRLIA